ncbi:MAG: F0F1 ATP synthase subunit B [bacterium]|nr:F0F1 ATP synthase subunit B [bacterium]
MSELLHALGIEWKIIVAQAINFAILLFVLGKFVYKPVMKMLDERREGTLKAIEREEFSTKKLLEAEADKESILVQARVESQRILEAARQDGEEMKKKFAAAAKEEIAKMHAEASLRLKSERTKLLSEVKGEIGSLVVSTIEQTLGDVLDARTQGKMVEQALAAIREGSKKS